MTKPMSDLQKAAKFFRKIHQTYLNGVKPAQFIRTLKEKEIDVVVDVRSWPKNPPYYNPNQMKELLKIHGFDYIQFQKLGNPPYLSKKASSHKEAKKIYIAYLKETKAAKQELRKLFYKLRLNKRFCFICYCRTNNPRECHRFWLIEILMNRKKKKLGLEPNFDIYTHYKAKIVNSLRKDLKKIKLKQQKMEEWVS